MIKKQVILETDKNGMPSFNPMKDSEKKNFWFGDSVGLLVFRGWYPCISHPKHFANSEAYDFPVRIGFVDDPFNLEDMANEAWNLKNWINAAQQLEADGVKALVGGCGLTGMMQSKIAESVNIPFFSSTMMYIPMLMKTLARDKKVGVLTVSEDSLNLNNGELFTELDIDKSRIIVRGMDQAGPELSSTWATGFNDNNYDHKAIEDSIVTVARKLINENPSIECVVLECTEMPPYADAIRKAINKPVFDAVQMTKMVYNMIIPR